MSIATELPSQKRAGHHEDWSLAMLLFADGRAGERRVTWTGVAALDRSAGDRV